MSSPGPRAPASARTASAPAAARHTRCCPRCQPRKSRGESPRRLPAINAPFTSPGFRIAPVWRSTGSPAGPLAGFWDGGDGVPKPNNALLAQGGRRPAPLTRIGSLAAARHRLRGRGKAELPKHSKLVYDSPVLGDLAVDDLHDVRLCPLRVLPGGRHPKGLTLVGAADGRIAGHEVTFGNLEIDAELQVRKSFAHLRYDRLESLAARGHARGRVAMLFDIGHDDLVDYGKASLLERLEGNAPGDRLVLLC